MGLLSTMRYKIANGRSELIASAQDRPPTRMKTSTPRKQNLTIKPSALNPAKNSNK